MTSSMIEDEKKVEIFRAHQARLFGVAYRMTGAAADAEDILQEAYLRWHQADLSAIVTPEAWLVTIVTRLAIDRLRKAAHSRETYIGPWLPEPLVASTAPSPEEETELASSLSLAFLYLLERLSPVERAVFLLHDVFDFDYAEIARVVGKSETASRQIAHRARERVRRDTPRFEADEKKRVELIRKFSAASHGGDEKALLALFSEEIAMVSDGGGKVKAARKIVRGQHRLAHLFAITGRKAGGRLRDVMTTINGQIGLLTFYEETLFAATVFEFEDGKISELYRVMNPDKLKSLAEAGASGENFEHRFEPAAPRIDAG
jgi:RNA polymerase sigma-70 factor, ECF subfamily